MTFKELKNKLSNEEHIISPYRDIVYGKNQTVHLYWESMKKMEYGIYMVLMIEEI